ncbi:hypothetical protein evm_010221 [Chilo suppressalis]|nr:hypothetical protein evm_010221 [Chilo suppressalis]
MMIANAPDSPIQAEVIFVIEATSSNGAYISELKTNYIIPTLEYFHGGPLEEGGGTGSVYCIVTYKSADCHPEDPVDTYGPFKCPQAVIEAVDKLQFIGGHSDTRACVTEGLATAIECFEELGRTDIPMHLLLLCCSSPYAAYAGGLVPQGVPATVEQAARQLSELGVQVSIAAAKRIPTLHSLYENAGGDLHQAQQRNYAKDPRHMVLLRGYSLKERPPSPAPPPIPDMQGEVYPQGRGMAGVPPVGGSRPPAPLFPRGAAPGRAGAWAPRHPAYPAQSALLTQLAQPSYPPQQVPAQASHQRMPGMMANQGPGSSTPPAAPQRSFIWSGVIEWMEKGKAPGDQQKTTRHLSCQVSAGSKEVEPELKVDTWPNKLLMQLMPKQLISNIGGQYLKDSKSVLFHLQPSEALDALTKVMVNGFAGCVHFSLMSSPPQCDIKVLILLYTPDKKAYLGFIPNNQATFVDRLRKVIQQQKITQIINKQLPAAGGASPGMSPALPSSTMAATGALPTSGMSQASMGAGTSMAGTSMQGASMPGSSMQGASMQGANMQAANMPGASGLASGMPQVGQMQAAGGQLSHPQGMMINPGMGGQVPQVGGKGPRPVTQLDGLEAARQQNLEKIQHLQQTLEAAHQQQFKSQMDIMNHLHAAQQQEQHYKQLEEQRKHQIQQQLQQQLRGAGGAGVGVGVGGGVTHAGHAGHAAHAGHARLMRPLLPSNPGLRHLLQQQPQYRPGGGPPRPPSQTQQFDDVNNYNDFLQ